MMYLFSTGDDCVGKYSEEAPYFDTNSSIAINRAGDNNTVANSGQMNIQKATSKVGSTFYGHKSRFADFGDEISDIAEAFNPVSGVSNFFENTIHGLSYNYIQRYFHKICGNSQQADYEHSHYFKFCKEYKSNGCMDYPKQPICVKAATIWYEKERVVGKCYDTFLNSISLSNRIEKDDRQQGFDKAFPLIQFCIIIFLVCGTLAFEYWHEEYSTKLNSDTVTIGDYTLRISGLPHGKKFEALNLTEIIKHAFRKEGYFLKGVNFIYNTDKYTDKKEKFWESISELYKMEYLRETSTDPFAQINTDGDLLDNSFVQESKYCIKAKKLQQEIAEMEQEFRLQDSEHMIGKAYIFFNRAEHRDHCFERYKRTGFTYKCFGFGENTDDKFYLPIMGKKKQIFFDRPKEPNDVIWEDLRYGHKRRFIRGVFSTLISFIIISMGFGLMYYLKTSQTISSADKEIEFSLKSIGMEHFLSLTISIIISLVGVVLKVAIKLLSRWQKPGSITEEQLLITKKLWKMQFINMAIVPFLISAAMLNFFDLGGLVEEIHLIFLINMILPHIMELFIDIDLYVKKWKRHRLFKFLTTGKGAIYNQKQANEIVEGVDFNISEPYSYTFSTIASALFYLPIFPLGMVYAILSLVMQYWASKVRILPHLNLTILENPCFQMP